MHLSLPCDSRCSDPPVRGARHAMQVTRAQFLRREGFHHRPRRACRQGRHPTQEQPHRSRMQANRLEHSESMGSNAHLWRLQLGRRRLLHDLLLPLPSAHAQASQVRRFVSVFAFTFNLPHFSQSLPYPTLSAIGFNLASACLSLQSPSQAHPLLFHPYPP